MDPKIKPIISRFTAAIESFSGYDDALKAEFVSASKALLHEIVEALGVDAPIRHNAAGVAVSGDVIAHGDAIYIDISAECRHLGLMVRGCAGRKDYCGLVNLWVQVEDIEREFEAGLPTFRRALASGLLVQPAVEEVK